MSHEDVCPAYRNALLFLPPLLHSNSCTCPASSAWPSWGSRGASYTGPAVLSAAWPETPTVPGMDRPAPDTSPWAGGNEDRGGGRLSARVTRAWTRFRIYSYCVQSCSCWLLSKDNSWSSLMWHISTTWFFKFKTGNCANWATFQCNCSFIRIRADRDVRHQLTLMV